MGRKAKNTNPNKHPGGAPVTKWTPEFIEFIRLKLLDYIDTTDIPIFMEFCYLNDVNYTQMYEFTELTETIKKCRMKKESQLERKGLLGEVNTSMAIFSLKQLGWKDQQEVVHDVKEELSQLANSMKGNFDKRTPETTSTS